jgi:hypothetical protein
MNFKRIAVGSVTAFTATLLVGAVVTLIWNLGLHGRSIIDWSTSLRIAIVMGLILPWITIRRTKGQ